MEIPNLMIWSYKTTMIKKFPSTKKMRARSDCS